MVVTGPSKCKDIEANNPELWEKKGLKDQLPINWVQSSNGQETQLTPELFPKLYEKNAAPSKILDEIVSTSCQTKEGQFRLLGPSEAILGDIAIGTYQGIKAEDIPVPSGKEAEGSQELNFRNLVVNIRDHYPPNEVDPLSSEFNPKSFLYNDETSSVETMILPKEEAAIIQAAMIETLKHLSIDLDGAKKKSQTLLVKLKGSEEANTAQYALSSKINNAELINIKRMLKHYFSSQTYARGKQKGYKPTTNEPGRHISKVAEYRANEVLITQINHMIKLNKGMGETSYAIPPSVLGEDEASRNAARAKIKELMGETIRVRTASDKIADPAATEELHADLTRKKNNGEEITKDDLKLNQELGDYILLEAPLDLLIKNYLRLKFSSFDSKESPLFIQHPGDENTYYIRRPDFQPEDYVGSAKELYNLKYRTFWELLKEDLTALKHAADNPELGLDKVTVDKIDALIQAVDKAYEIAKKQSTIHQIREGHGPAISFTGHATAMTVGAMFIGGLAGKAWTHYKLTKKITSLRAALTVAEVQNATLSTLLTTTARTGAAEVSVAAGAGEAAASSTTLRGVAKAGGRIIGGTLLFAITAGAETFFYSRNADAAPAREKKHIGETQFSIDEDLCVIETTDTGEGVAIRPASYDCGTRGVAKFLGKSYPGIGEKAGNLLIQLEDTKEQREKEVKEKEKATKKKLSAAVETTIEVGKYFVSPIKELF